MWGALSAKRTGLSFTIAAGPRQGSHSLVPVLWDSRPYFTLSDLRLPFLFPPTTHRATVSLNLTTDGQPASLATVSLESWVLCYDRRSAGESVLE
jgi:hypothetical protein